MLIKKWIKQTNLLFGKDTNGVDAKTKIDFQTILILLIFIFKLIPGKVTELSGG